MEPQKKGLMYVYKLAAGSQRNQKPTGKTSVVGVGWWWMAWREVVEGRKSVSNIEARKSVSHVETNVAAVAGLLQVKVLVTDMPGFMQVHAFRCARTTYDSLEKFSSKHMAYNMKKEFDKVYGPAWHCIVGSSFGSFVTHSTGT
ncbi:dynein light chain type 1 family protein [Actinidia rufa]|uniref:Dynein light chain n=1 Tax=Actinidia rufa TaxID=165716 RepID=A0A7J0FM24_9ERIC|nr:dynein light chain type 1 family protein [Actinidia rufa]